MAYGYHFIYLRFYVLGETEFILIGKIVYRQHDKRLDEARGIAHPVCLYVDHGLIFGEVMDVD